MGIAAGAGAAARMSVADRVFLETMRRVAPLSAAAMAVTSASWSSSDTG
jgi:hypothetical protein